MERNDWVKVKSVANCDQTIETACGKMVSVTNGDEVVITKEQWKHIKNDKGWIKPRKKVAKKKTTEDKGGE